MRGGKKEKDSKLEDSSIFKFLSPAHEIPSADLEPGIIVAEMQAGYMIKDRLLRPALVGVAKAAD